MMHGIITSNVYVTQNQQEIAYSTHYKQEIGAIQLKVALVVNSVELAGCMGRYSAV